MRVLHSPENIGNQPWVLSRHERALGAQSDLVICKNTWLDYPADRVLATTDSSRWSYLVRRAWFGLTSPLRYDVLHYYFGRSFLSWNAERRIPGRFFDLKLARRIGRKVFMTLQGCDARISSRNSDRNRTTMCQLGNCSFAPKCRAATDKNRLALIENILPYCHRVFVLNPDLAHDVPRAVFLPYANVDVESMIPKWPRTDGPIRLLHAPTNEGAKGTPYILSALERLKRRWPIELILVHGQPHAEAVKKYVQADLVIDQVLAGWYGGFAVEAMALGKPVACFVRETDLGPVPASMRSDMPILKIDVNTLEEDLEALFRRRREWPEWGRKARNYVLKWHHPRIIAGAMLRAYAHPQSRFDLEFDVEAAARQAA